MEHEKGINIHQILETSDVTFDWKIQTTLEAPLNACGLISFDEFNRKTPAFYELLNAMPDLPTLEELTQTVKMHGAAWPEAANAIAAKDLPNEAERSAFLYKTRS